MSDVQPEVKKQRLGGSKKNSLHRNTNGVPRDEQNRVVHLGVKPGEVANRVISVGSAKRASKLAEFFDPETEVLHRHSDRGFDIHTGKFNGVDISIITTNMGIANMDFVVREARSVVSGPMAIVRYGTSGALRDDIAVGSVVVAGDGAVMLTRNPDAFHSDASKEESPYRISRVVPADAKLTQKVHDSLSAALDVYGIKVVSALNVTACSFYSSQGRLDPKFDDRNESNMKDVLKKHPNAGTMEMETFHLLDLARCSREKIIASAAVIALASRTSGEVLDGQSLDMAEKMGGKAIMSALASFDII